MNAAPAAKGRETMNLAKKVQATGFQGTTTEWLTSAPRAADDPKASGWITARGTWNPDASLETGTATEKQARFGGDLGVGYLTENGGQHGSLYSLAREVVAKMWPDVAFDLAALFDLQYVGGLSRWIIAIFRTNPEAEQWAQELGWDEATRDEFFGRPRTDIILPPATPGQPVTLAPFTPTSDRQLLEIMAQGLERIDRTLAKLSPGGSDDGKALTALKILKTRAARLEALTSTPKHQRFDELVTAVDAAIADGGAGN